jgi:hypothetical protein
MGKYKAYKPEPEGDLEIDGIPTAAGLMKMGRQFAYKRGVDNKIVITAEGNALLGKALRDSARRDQEEGIWHGTTGRHHGIPPQPGLSPDPLDQH